MLGLIHMRWFVFDQPPHTTPGAAGGGPWRRRAARCGLREHAAAQAPDAPAPPRPAPAPAQPRPLAASDHGVVLTHGDGPGGCDVYGARDVVVWPVDGTLYMHYDGCGVGRLAAVPGHQHGRSHLDEARPGAASSGRPGAATPRALVRDAVPPRRQVASVLRRHAERHGAAGAGARGAVLHAEGGGVRAPAGHGRSARTSCPSRRSRARTTRRAPVRGPSSSTRASSCSSSAPPPASRCSGRSG